MTSYYAAYEVHMREPNSVHSEESDWGNLTEENMGEGGSGEWDPGVEEPSWTSSRTSWRRSWQGHDWAENWSWDGRSSDAGSHSQWQENWSWGGQRQEPWQRGYGGSGHCHGDDSRHGHGGDSGQGHEGGSWTTSRAPVSPPAAGFDR